MGHTSIKLFFKFMFDSTSSSSSSRLAISTKLTLGTFGALLFALLLALRKHGRHLWNSVSSQPALFALFGASGFSLATTCLYILSQRLYASLRPMFISTITVENSDQSFDTVLDYITKQGIVSTGDKRAVTSQRKNMTMRERIQEWAMGRQQAPTLEFRPDGGDALTVFNWKGTSIYMTRSKGEVVTTGHDRKPTTLEKIRLQTFGMDDSVLRQFLNAAMESSFDTDREMLNIWVMCDDWWGSWEKAMSKKPRSVDSVVLNGNLSSELIQDATNFFARSDWYVQAGIPYRRGYLLHGPPGCGKTSFCQALAGALKLDLCMLTLANKSLDDTKLARVIRDSPTGAMILLEDVDAVFVDRSVTKDGSNGGSGVTFSGLLNAIDGVASQEGRIFIMTTNHIEKLDPALIRPGRCDVNVKLCNASKAQVKALFLRFFPGQDGLGDTFAKRIPEFELSMAALQGHLLKSKASAKDAVDSIGELLKTKQPK